MISKGTVATALAAAVTFGAAGTAVLIPEPVVIQGAIKCQPDGGWAVLDGQAHQPQGGLAVDGYTTSGIWVRHDHMDVIHTFQVTPDETLAMITGASVGHDRTFIRTRNPNGTVRNPRPCGDTSGNLWVDGAGTDQ